MVGRVRRVNRRAKERPARAEPVPAGRHPVTVDIKPEIPERVEMKVHAWLTRALEPPILAAAAMTRL